MELTLEQKRTKIQELIEQTENLIEQTSHAYAEPGYSDPEVGIIVTANWNNDNEMIKGSDIGEDPEEDFSLHEAIEALGGEIEWSDEWTNCDECSKLVRTSADSYSWRRSYFVDEEGCSITCHECVKEDPENYIEYLKGSPDRAMTFDIDLSEHGYEKLDEEFERGFHPGQAADPHKIAKALREQGIEDYIFELDEARQFDVTFSVWIPEDADVSLDEYETDSDVSPATRMKQGLQEASAQMSQLDGDGVKYSRIDTSTGKAETKIISREDFIKGNL